MRGRLGVAERGRRHDEDTIVHADVAVVVAGDTVAGVRAHGPHLRWKLESARRGRDQR